MGNCVACALGQPPVCFNCGKAGEKAMWAMDDIQRSHWVLTDRGHSCKSCEVARLYVEHRESSKGYSQGLQRASAVPLSSSKPPHLAHSSDHIASRLLSEINVKSTTHGLAGSTSCSSVLPTNSSLPSWTAVSPSTDSQSPGGCQEASLRMSSCSSGPKLLSRWHVGAQEAVSRQHSTVAHVGSHEQSCSCIGLQSPACISGASALGFGQSQRSWSHVHGDHPCGDRRPHCSSHSMNMLGSSARCTPGPLSREGRQWGSWREGSSAMGGAASYGGRTYPSADGPTGCSLPDKGGNLSGGSSHQGSPKASSPSVASSWSEGPGGHGRGAPLDDIGAWVDGYASKATIYLRRGRRPQHAGS